MQLVPQLEPTAVRHERTDEQARTGRLKRTGPQATGAGPRARPHVRALAGGPVAPPLPATRTNGLYRTTSPPDPNPTPARTSAAGGYDTGQCVGFRRGRGGGDCGFIINRRLPPGHDPGAGYGVETASLQMWHLAIRHFGLFGGPVAAANDYLTSERTNDSCARPSGRDGAAGARPGGSRRSRRSRLSRPTTAGHGRTFRTRGHGPGVTNQERTARVRVRTADLSTAVTAVVTADAAPPGSQPGAPSAAPTRSSARWRVNGEPMLRGGDRLGGGNHQGGRAGQTKRT